MKENLLFRSFPPWKDTKQTNRRIRMKPCVAAEAGSWGGGLCGWEGAVEGKQRAGYVMGTSCLLKEMTAGLIPELWAYEVAGWFPGAQRPWSEAVPLRIQEGRLGKITEKGAGWDRRQRGRALERTRDQHGNEETMTERMAD